MKYPNLIFKIIILFIIPFLTIQCSSDNDLDSSTYKSSSSSVFSENDDFILGEWAVTDVSMKGNMVMNDNSYEWGWVFSNLPFPIESKSEILDYSVNFSKEANTIRSKGIINGIYIATINDYLKTYEYSKAIENLKFFSHGNWIIDKNTIIINNNETYLIEEISANKLVIVKSIKDDALITTSYDPNISFKSIANIDIYLTLEKK